jgi:hypothetical protein
MSLTCLSACLVSTSVLVACNEDDPVTASKRDTGGEQAGDAAVDTGGDAADATDAADTDTTAAPAELRVQPTQIFFEDVEIGESKTASISLANVGGSPLFITDVVITEREPEDTAELKPGESWLEGDSLTLEPSSHTTLEVLYEPDDHAIDRGFVTITSTDPNNSPVVVPIETVNAYPDIDVLRTLRFGTVAVGETATEEIVIHNRGYSPLTVDEILMSGDPSFSVEMQAPYTTPAVIEKDDYIIFEATYAPYDDETDRATIYVESNDPDEESFEIGVAGNEPTPCIRVSTTSIDFGDVAVGAREVESVTVLNCSETQQLTVSQVSLSTDGGGTFSINQAPTTPATIAPTTTEQIQVAASGDDERDAVGVLVVESDDPEQGGLVIDLRAKFVAQ